ncbi:AAA-like domain-containing protein [Phormidium tenue]|uniref:ATPase n=1 Tax=Phormidium tenue NIES-30 TaxID=549789 RepID=A0A1U7J5V9_9CYAN|nr:AAA-like domain-containing protein [Phormidium tenue]MBD2232106.1 AAA-like domain-containing protein [Phormidium tenue FACHB-1052]OKH48308.1 ATPase [Phormidium tenue NIES-30]
MPSQPPVRRILILAANPTDTSRLRLDAEVREIQEGLKRSDGRKQFEVTSRWAVRTDDLRRALLEHEPHIVHFSGHGDGEDGLTLEDGQGKAKLVNTAALTRLFKQFPSIECVLLNACYSEVQATALATLGPYVIGMNRAIGDRAAIEFAKGFYDGLGYNRTYPDAFEFGLTAIDLEGIPETATPVLKQGKPQLIKPDLAPESTKSRNFSPVFTPQPQAETQVRIFLSYKRGVEPDEPVALDIYAALSSQHQVFIDQAMVVGTPWVEAIKREIAQADVLIVLLSATSLQSEMVQQEIELAYEAANDRHGLPKIFPVRLAHTAPFPYPLNQYLDPLQWAFLETPTDTPQLITQLQSALAGNSLPIDTEIAKQKLLQRTVPISLAPPTPLAQPPAYHTPLAIPLEPPEGSMDTESEFYIERAEDTKALSALQRKGGTVTILGPRQMGKSSLLIRTITQARQQQKRVVFLDFQRLEIAALTEDDLFYRRFCEWMTVSLRLPSQVDTYWDKYKSLGNPLRCTYYVQDYLLAEVNQSIFLAMDEVDKLIAAPFRDEFFSMLRSWHNERAFEPVWKLLDLAMVTCTEPYQLIQDLNQSPFNVGTSLTLKDFNETEVAELNRRHNGVLSLADQQTLMAWVGGHPYLTRKALYEAASGNMTAADVFDAATVDQGPFGGHLRYHLFRMDDKPHLVQGMLQVIRSQTCSDEQVLRRLERAGLVRRVGRQVQPRCRLYAEYFREHLRE